MFNSNIRERRSELKRLGRYAEAIPLQKQILADAESRSDDRDIANAYNYLAMLCHRSGLIKEAESAAIDSIETHCRIPDARDESLATYEMLLAHILATDGRFREAVHYGELAIGHFSTFHTPPTDFLRDRQDEVLHMRSHLQSDIT